MARSKFVKRDKREILKEDLSIWIYAEMRRNKKNQAHMAGKLGISRSRFCVKLKEGNFKNDELYIIFDELKANKEAVTRLMGVA